MRNSLLWGVVGSVGITIVFYLIQVLGMQSWTAPVGFMLDKWYFVLPLVIGFGVQAGFFRAIREKAKRGSAAIAASGGMSTTSMAACCLHNLVPLVPLLGATGIATFFTVYQSQVFLASILFVIVGVMYMWRTYNRLHLYCKEEVRT